jgi:hypothetical protein
LKRIAGDASAEPPARSADRDFAARVGVAVAEAERFRAWRRRALRRLAGDALILVALAGAVLTAASAPAIAPVLADISLAAPAAASLVLVLWLVLTPQRRSAFAR